MLTPRILLAALTALALTSAQQCITPSPPTPDAPTLLASSESTTVIVTDPGSDASTHRLAQSFATDIRAVVPGATVKLLNATSLASLGAKPAGENWVVLGALDGSPLVNEAVNATGIDVAGTRGEWEAWTVGKGVVAGSQVVVVAGADRVSARRAKRAYPRAKRDCLDCLERSETTSAAGKDTRAKRDSLERSEDTSAAGKGFAAAVGRSSGSLIERSHRWQVASVSLEHCRASVRA